MNLLSRSGGGEDGALEVLWEDGERVFCRTWREGPDGSTQEFVAVTCAGEQPTPGGINRLAHEYGLKDDLDAAWALRPLDLAHERGRTILLLESTRGEPLDRVIGRPMEVGRFLRLAVSLSAALCPLHQRGLIHKDIKPSNIIVDVATDQIWLTGFGIASRLPRERHAPGPPELIAGTLAYMAPEQTGRMNRSIDSRSDLYALGMTFYEMLTGSLPFTASDPMEWVHCHVARQAVAPGERTSGIPETLSSIVLKLLAKTPEERYQTAAGVEADLRRSLGEWQAHGRIDPFPLGGNDAPDRLLITEELYGREDEISSLLSSFDRVITQGAPELMLVCGYSGVGKSSVVNELHKALAPRRGLFAAGKFDRYKRDIPYATVAHAFRALIRQILLKSEAEVEQWRTALREALGAQGQLIVNLVPELEFIVEKQPAVPDLPPRDAQNRFQMVFRRFLGVFARREHPLALFLDDLQWLDAATLDLIEHLVTHPEVRHLLLIGAYRDNEVDSAHPLLRTLEAIKKTDARVGEIVLAPLRLGDVGRLVAGAVRGDAERARPLTQLLYAKTGGNPFFAIQFLTELAEEGLLAFHPVAQAWRWEIDRIDAKDYTDNVVDLMVEKLKRLSPPAQEAMKLLACLGHAAEIGVLTLGYEETEEAMHATLREAVYAGLVEQQDGAYRFLHDRIQQAAYSLIPDRRRADIHLQIGRALLASMTEDQLAEHLFDVVSQFNRATALIASRDEREQLARLNLIAGRRAKASTAYASALKYLASGASLLTGSAWRRRHDLIFSLELLRAECEFLTGELAAGEARLTMLSKRAAGAVEQAAVACLRMDLLTTLDQAGGALTVGLDYLRLQGVDWSPHPTDEEVRCEYERVWSRLGSRTIEELIDLPLMTDPAPLATLDVLIKLWPAALFTDMNVFSLTVCRAINLSLDHGNSDASCTAYVRLGAIAESRFGDYQAALRLGRLGYALVEQRGLKRFQARTYMLFGCYILPWAQHVMAARDVLRGAYLSANESGDLTFAAYSAMCLNSNMLAANDPLVEVQREAEHGLAFAQKMQFGLAVDTIATQLQLVRMLRGLTPAFGSFDDERFSELQITRRFSANPNLGHAECYYWIRKLQASVLAGDYAAAVDASLRPSHLLWAVRSLLEMTEYHFYAALARAACCDSFAPERRQQHLEALAAHHQEIEIWARRCPENFANRAALVAAEIARLEGREVDAERLYEEAIRSARDHGFVQNEGLAYETAAQFYRAPASRYSPTPTYPGPGTVISAGAPTAKCGNSIAVIHIWPFRRVILPRSSAP
jgi:predicted ATPase